MPPAVECIWWIVGCAALGTTIAAWRKRDRSGSWPATRIFLLATAEIGLLALVSFVAINPTGLPLAAGWNDVQRAVFCLANVLSGLMAFFAIMERAAKKASKKS